MSNQASRWAEEAKQRKATEEKIARLWLFGSSFVMSAAFLGAVVFLTSSGMPIELRSRTPLFYVGAIACSIVPLVLGAVANSLVAGIAVLCAEGLYQFATRDREPWCLSVRTWCAAFWPFVLVFWLIVAPVYASINRIFIEEDSSAAE